MERLTKVDGQGRLLAYLINDTGLPTIITSGNPYRKLIEKLKAYEDTALEPEEVASINGQQNFEVWASDNTDYTLTCKDGIYSVADKYGHIVCEFIR